MAIQSGETGTLEGKGGLRLYYRWRPVDDARAVAVVVHGLAEHSGRYEHVFAALGEGCVSALGVDLRGHGRSGGARVYVDRFEDYVEDVERAIALARERAPGLPLFVIGHSMGGLVAIHHALAHGAGVAGYVFSSPGLRAAVRVPAWKDALGKVMSKVWPGLAIPTGIGPELVSSDPAVVAAYANDPLVTKTATARWYASFVAAQASAMARAGELLRPSLVLLGEADKLVDPRGGQDFFAVLGATDKTLKTYPGLYHEVFNEPEQQRVLADVVAWIGARP